ncbi:unnamed protein product [marine sediment metagenome]|uniref:Uncharacterized protein n=1 Tax=marine sediment metagenome TaxID=412755 RepID=X1G6B3_9ZZZZ
MKAEIFHNKNKDGIEVAFSEAPEEFYDLQLGSLGFKYSKMQKLYYAPYSNVLWNAVHEALDEFLPEDKKLSVKKEISIPEIDTDIFDKVHIKNQIENKQFTFISIYLPTKGGSIEMVALHESFTSPISNLIAVSFGSSCSGSPLPLAIKSSIITFISMIFALNY